MFLEYILKNNICNKLYLLGFVIAIISYSLWQPLEEIMEFSQEKSGSIFYIGIAFSFCCYTSAYLFTKWDKWRWFPMFVTLICLGRLSKELYILIFDYVDSEKYDIFDYINFLITIYIVFMYYISWRKKKYCKKRNN